jgi:hypothetical protein
MAETNNGLKVLYVPSWGQSPQDASGLSLQLKPVAEVTGKGWTQQRKFVVYHQPEGIFVVIGPVFGNTEEDGYFHKDIFDTVGVTGDLRRLGGGGYVGFSFDGRSFTASFGRRSSDYGVFSVDILTRENRQQIANQLGMPVLFEWTGSASPQKSS